MSSVRRHACREALEASLVRAEEPDHSAIFTHLYQDEARSAADAADERRQRNAALSPVDGLLVAIKDNFDIKGEPTTAGSKILRYAAPAKMDAMAIARLRAAGAIIVGKTNMTEFAYSGLGLNPHFGTPHNAIAPDRIPGGSSSGAGVAVASGLVDLAIGTDTGGSVRIPAAFNGVCGFKPTSDRIPCAGVFPLSHTLDSVGPIARSVGACIKADALMAAISPWQTAPKPLAGLRFGLVDEHLDCCDSIVLQSFQRAVDILRQNGSVIESAHVGPRIEAMRATLAAAPIVPAEAAQLHATRLTSHAGEFDPYVHSRIKTGMAIASEQYLASVRRRTELATSMDRAFAELDGLLSPTTAIVAPRFADVEEKDRHESINRLVLRNTGFANFFDLCSLTIPLQTGSLPAGLMISSRHGRDQALLEIGLTVEATLERSGARF